MPQMVMLKKMQPDGAGLVLLFLEVLPHFHQGHSGNQAHSMTINEQENTQMEHANHIIRAVLS